MEPNKRPSSDPALPNISKRLCKVADTIIVTTGVNEDITVNGAHESPAICNQPNATPVPQLVWATNRQSLCDSLPDFKSHQGGVYTKGKEPHGVLFGQNVEIGDRLLGDKCISSIGGGRMMTEDGNWARNANYKPKSFTEWETAKEKQLPILVVMDHRHPHFYNIDISSIPRQPEVEPAYVVLGMFFVTEIWQEMGQSQNGAQYPVVKLMYQRIHTDGKPAYWQGEYHNPQVQDIHESFMQYTCNDCGKTSPAAFEDQPCVCLNHNCKSFFCVNGVQLQRCSLEYATGFLNWIKPYTGDLSSIPAIFSAAPCKGNEEYGTELRFRTGLVCSKCLHCDSRVWFNFWKCGSCGLVQMAEPEPYPMAEIEDETHQHTEKLKKSSALFKMDQTTIFMEKKLVTVVRTPTKNSVRTIYLITEPTGIFCGTLVHERPDMTMLQGSCGANDLWKEIQDPGVAQNLKRYAAVCPGSVVQKLTRHFIQNFGFHYDYGVKVGDTSFSAAPDVVLKSLVQLSHMGKMAVESSQELAQSCGFSMPEDSTLFDAWQQPNEVLVLAYMEKDLINYHDDGEAQLNGTISTLSLGSPATMKVRIKGTRASKTAGTDKIDAVPVLDIQLQHGDVVTMCDTRLQALTEHAIEPMGIRRFAMTSRVIKPEYYLETKPAKKLMEQNLTLNGMRESARIPSRAANFTFVGTTIQVDDSNTLN